MNEYINEEMFSLFIEDSKEGLSKIPSAIIELENNPEEKEAINEIFRAVHSIKGAAGVLEFDVLAEISHIYETLLDKARAGKIRLNSEIIDFLFFGFEVIDKILEKIKIKKSDITFKELEGFMGVNKETFQEKANEFLKVKKKKVEKIEGINESLLLQNTQKTLYKIDIKLHSDEMMKQARLFIIYNALANSEKLLESVPSIELIEKIDDDVEFVEDKGTFYLDTDKNKEELNLLFKGFEIESFELFKLSKDIIEEIHEENEKFTSEIKEEIIEKNPEKVEEKKSEKTKNNRIKENDFKVKEYVKVEREKLDNLFNIVGELFIEKSVYNQMYMKLEEIYNGLLEENVEAKQLKPFVNFIDAFAMLNKNQERELTELQEISNSLRMVPIRDCFAKFPMAMRGLTSKLNKKVELKIEGEDTELDKILSEKLTDPLLHMLRNSVDHGIESPEERLKAGKSEKGTVKIGAYNLGNNIIIKVSDDGGGINAEKLAENALKKGIISQNQVDNMTEDEKLRIIFMPGFSTAEKVSNISGRGVGMDVVRKNIESIKGKIDIKTKLGKGTTFSIKLPLTLAIIRALLVKISGNLYSFPSDSVVTIEKVENKKIEKASNSEIMKFRETVIPIICLKEIFKSNNIIKEENKEYTNIVVLRHGSELYGFKVDEFVNQQYIVIKNIEGTYHKGKAILGAAVLGDGSLSMVVDINNLIDGYEKSSYKED